MTTTKKGQTTLTSEIFLAAPMTFHEIDRNNQGPEHLDEPHANQCDVVTHTDLQNGQDLTPQSVHETQ